MPTLQPEHRLVPYECGDLPEGPWLVLAPHADDETFGLGGTLLLAAARGIQTHVLVLTDGARGGDGTTDRETLVATRHDEVRRATQQLGVASLILWNEPDGALDCSAELIQRVSRMVQACAARTVFFPAPLELHPDHRMTARIAWHALQRLSHPPRPCAYEISVQSPVNCLIDVSDVYAAKREAMAVYNSQNRLNAYPKLVEALNRARTYTLPEAVTHAEGLYLYDTEKLSGSLREATEERLSRYW